ncbi:MAG: proteasome assembly chaperone family protein [Promethearchaeota archaeon]|nr:MAG: proteasome assembly chaperone family protein [Candidatus Lokiarchaeota archaeon]
MEEQYICEKGDKSTVVVQDMPMELKDDPTLMFGLASVGLIGPIIAETLIKQIDDMKQIGFVASDLLPPIAVFHNAELMHPFRLYYTRKYNIILGIAEVPFQVESAYNDLAKTLFNWALSDDINAKEIITFQGIPQKGMIDEFPVYYAAEENSIDKFKQIGIEKIDKGIITGPGATLVNNALNNNIQPIVLFTPVYKIATPEGAASIIEVLNEIFGMDIDTEELIEKGREIKKRMKALADKAQEYRKNQLAGSQQGTPYSLYQ